MLINIASYIAKTANKQGIVDYTIDENNTWHILITRQMDVIKNRACDEFIAGLHLLNFPHNKIPQCPEVSVMLQQTTGWQLEPVEAIISFDRFFELLSQKRFPAATFIRREEDLDYIKEPDIFHEIFGHCPLLTNQAYADFVYAYGKLGLKATAEERVLLARLFWFTIEFGLIQTPQGLRAYGGGILSSPKETVYSLESQEPTRLPFNVINALQTNYHIDKIQPVYFIINHFDQLYELIHMDLIRLIREVQYQNTIIPRHPC